MKIFLASIVAVALFSVEGAGGLDIIRKNPHSPEFEVVSQELSADGAKGTVVFSVPGGIFRCNLDLAGTKFSELTFVIKDQKYWEGVDFGPSKGESIDLKGMPGVEIHARGSDCVIHFAPAAVKVLRRGGGFQFINQYRR